jgi:hypothetical protein
LLGPLQQQRTTWSDSTLFNCYKPFGRDHPPRVVDSELINRLVDRKPCGLSRPTNDIVAYFRHGQFIAWNGGAVRALLTQFH